MRFTQFAVALVLFLPVALFAQQAMHMTDDSMKTQSQPMPKDVKDSRQNIPLTEAERTIVMAQMRQMLASVQGVTDGLSRGDLQAVVDAASKSGMAMMKSLPSQIRMKFPSGFAQMGMASHQTFDRIARETKSIKDPAPVLRQLSVAVQNCIACHATYRFVLSKK